MTPTAIKGVDAYSYKSIYLYVQKKAQYSILLCLKAGVVRFDPQWTSLGY